MAHDIPQTLDALYRSDSRRILATLIRLLGDFDLAEDALHDAFRVALEQWPAEGIPANPVAWLISTGRFKAVDRIRKSARTALPLEVIGDVPEPREWEAPDPSTDAVADDRLRLIFTCCHPLLPPEARTALTLREVCGLTTEEIARAFLTTPATLAKRIVRAKNQIRDEAIPYEIPPIEELPSRLSGVLQIIYLVFNEGYSASSGESLTRAELSSEAIRLGRLLLNLLPEPEVRGLLALMLFHESRRAARATPQGDLILLDDQDRSLWNKALIQEATVLVRVAFQEGRVGLYTLQAAIASVHALAPRPDATDWPQIVSLYDLLLKATPSPVVELNRAVAIAMRDGPAAGLTLVDDLLARGVLDTYHWIYSVRGDLCRRLGKKEDATDAYQEALRHAQQAPERRFLEDRIHSISKCDS